MDRALSLSRKSFSLLIIGTTLFCSSAKAAIPTKCLEIESILVDACGSPEGENEMVRFIVGPTAFNTSDLDITWPSNPYLGISPKTATTTAIVNTLNSTILSCGRLIEPTGGVLPAGKRVLLITSTAVSTSANSFANLTDTLYVIFQIAGNTGGHFVNYSSIPGIRTLVMKRTSTGCSDSVSYDKSLLTNQSGGNGGTTAQCDGGAVEYAWPGYPTATYVNHGCQAPFIPLTASAGTSAAICPGGIAILTGAITGNNLGVIWKGGHGTFSNVNSLNTTYTASFSDTNPVSLKIGIIGVCHDTVYSVPLLLTITNAAAPIVTSPLPYCQGASSIALTAIGSSLLWYNNPSGGTGSATAPTPSTATLGTFTYYVSQTVNGCNSARDSIKVIVSALPNANAGNDSTLTCAAPSLVLNGSSTTSNVTYSWSGAGIVSGGSTASPSINAAGTYTLTVNSLAGCTATDQVIISSNNILPNANAGNDAVLTCTTTSVVLNGTSGTTGAAYSWAGPGSFTSSQQQPNVSTAGTYTLTVTDPSNGCTSTSDQVIVSSNAVLPIASAGIDQNIGCGISSLNLDGSGSSSGAGYTYNWTTVGGNISSGATSVSPFVNQPGSYTLTVTNTANGCSATSAVTISASPTPVASFTTDPITGIAPLTVNFTNTSQNSNTYVWFLGDNGTETSSNPSHTYSIPGTYNIILVASENSQCPDTARFSIVVLDPFSLIIPNIFTPNSDGVNDQFIITGKGVRDFECVIFDRWGIKMAQLHNITIGWDGKTTSGAIANDGVYYYSIKATGLDGLLRDKAGFVQLSR